MYCFKGKFAAARKTLRRAEALFSAQPDSAAFGSLYAGYGMMHGMLSQYNSATAFYEKAIRLAQRTNDRDLLGTSYQHLAISYQMLSHYQQALSLAEEENNPASQAYVLINMGLTQKTIGDTVRAERALLDGLRFARQAGVRNGELYAYSNLASLYELERKHAKAYQYAIQAGALVIADSSHQPLNIFQVYSTMGAILKQQEKYAAALPYLGPDQSRYVRRANRGRLRRPGALLRKNGRLQKSPAGL